MIKKIYIAYFFSLLGDNLFLIALPLLIYSTTQNAIYTSLVYAIEKVPYVLVMPFMGGIIAKFSKRKLLLITDMASFIIMTLISVSSYLTLNGSLSVEFIFIPVFFLVSLDSINHPAFQVLVPKIVGKNELAKVNSTMNIMNSCLSIFGMILGGILVAVIGFTSIFLLNALSFLISFSIISTLSRDESDKDMKIKKPLGELIKNTRITFSHTLTKYLTLYQFFANISISLVNGGFIYYLKSNLNLNDAQVGYTFGVAAIGAIFGAGISPKLMTKFKHTYLFQWSGTGIAFACISLILADSIYSAIIFKFMLNFFSSMMVILTFTIRQRKIEKDTLSRVITISRPFVFLPVPVASILTGYLLQLDLGVYYISILAFFILIITTIIGWFNKSFIDFPN